MERTQEQRNREAEQNRQKLLAAESVALYLLLRRREQAVTAGIVTGGTIHSVALRVERAFSTGIADARQLARIAGASRLRAEAASLGFRIAQSQDIIAAEVARDLARARVYSRSYVRQWLKAAKGDSVAAQARAANDATRHALERTGITESSEAFNAGRFGLAKRIRRAPVRELLRVWDAQNDIGVCERCAKADGTIVGIKENFPEGEPGAVHPRCRCVWSLITAVERDEILMLQAA